MTYHRKTGDTGSALGPDRLTDEDGSTIDLTGATVVLTVWRSGDRGDQLLSDDTGGNVSIVSPSSDGKVKYKFQAGDLSDTGYYRYEWEVTFVDGETVTWPNDKPGEDLLVTEDGN